MTRFSRLCFLLTIPLSAFAQTDESTLRDTFLDYYQSGIRGDAIRAHSHWTSTLKNIISDQEYAEYKLFAINPLVRQRKKEFLVTWAREAAFLSKHFPVTVENVSIKGTKATVRYLIPDPLDQFLATIWLGITDPGTLTESDMQERINDALSKTKGKRKPHSSEWIREGTTWRVVEPGVEKMKSEYSLMKSIELYDPNTDRERIADACRQILKLNPSNTEAKHYVQMYEESIREADALTAGLSQEAWKEKITEEMEWKRNYEEALRLYEGYLKKYPNDKEMKERFPEWKKQGLEIWKAALRDRITGVMPDSPEQYADWCRKYFALVPSDPEIEKRVKLKLEEYAIDKEPREKCYEYATSILKDPVLKKEFLRTSLDYSSNDGPAEYVKWCKRYFAANPDDTATKQQVKSSLEFQIKASAASKEEKKIAFDYYTLLFPDDKSGREQLEGYVK